MQVLAHKTGGTYRGLRPFCLPRAGQGPMLSTMRPNSPQHLAHGKAAKWDTSGVLLDDSASQGRLDWAKIFGNTSPVEIEIGTGKGTFLLARAGERPEINFLGIEFARAYCRYAADRLRRRNLTNVRVVQAEAAAFFKICLADASVWRVHIYFPDPWPKRRHRRRRLIQPPFAWDVRRVLRAGGQLIIITDHIGYYRQIRNVLRSVPGLAPVPTPRADGELVGTNFERKYITQGRSFYAAAWLRYA